MKFRYLLLFFISVWMSACSIAKDSPARLAIIALDDESRNVADLLNAQLTQKGEFSLVERTEIERVYREQGLSAANDNYLKLGQILGADGVFLLQRIESASETNLVSRLVATKPGVILVNSRATWPTNPSIWAEAAANSLSGMRAKLLVLAKDALPISVINLRSAIPSEAANDTDRQLTALVVQRLSQEPLFFVLERQRMDLLSEEKDFAGEQSPFWAGGYLLEGVIDQNGYSAEKITVNLRLTPPKGATPIAIEVSSDRKDLAGLINKLAVKVNEALKVRSTVRAWNAADEAEQFLKEAKWALKWGDHKQAQAAAESAWALGKHDLQSAVTRVESYATVVSVGGVQYVNGSWTMGDKDLSRAMAEGLDSLKEIASEGHFIAMKHRIYLTEGAIEINYAGTSNSPNPIKIEQARRALELYYNLSKNLPDFGAHKEWNNVGMESLEAASEVLRDFNFVPAAQKPVANDLAELRNWARLVADQMTESVRGIYYITNRRVKYEAMSETLEGSPNIFLCKARWGAFWQEKPEDGIAFYRELMTSAAFAYIHDDAWVREVQTPRLVAWNPEDQKRLPDVWKNFLQELESSTNFLWRMEAKAFRVADAEDVQHWVNYFEELMQVLFANERAIAANNVDLLYLDWHLGGLVSHNGLHSEIREKEEQRYYKQYTRRLERIQRWHLDALTMEEMERKGLTSEEKPKVVVQKKEDPATNNPPAGVPASTTNASALNVVRVTQFAGIPLPELPPELRSFPPPIKFTSHHWYAGKLVVEFKYEATIYFDDGSGNQQLFPHNHVAVLDAKASRWELITCPEEDVMVENRFYHRTALVNGDLYMSEGKQVRRYDRASGKWVPLPISNPDNYELFAVAGRLYAANSEIIFEIADNGKTTRILASRRRQPSVTKLDVLDDFGEPVLFEGPGHSLRANIKGKVYTWTQNDWREDFSAEESDLLANGTLFRYSENPRGSMLYLSTESSLPVVGFERAMGFSYPPPPQQAGVVVKPLWVMPPGLITDVPTATMDGSNMVFLVDHSTEKKTVKGDSIVKVDINEQDGYHASLLYFSPDRSGPKKLYLRFDAPGACPPLLGVNAHKESHFIGTMMRRASPYWMIAADGWLIFGNDLVPTGQKPGVWMLPLSDLAPAIEAEKKRQAAEIAAAQQAKKDIASKYDSNHDGTLQPEEKQRAIGDADFLERNIETIEANHNGRLDAEELAYFDANKDKLLEPEEKAGIDIVQHLLAVRTMAKLDVNKDGRLDMREFPRWERSLPRKPGSIPPPVMMNEVGDLSPQSLEALLKEVTEKSIMMNTRRGHPVPQMQQLNDPSFRYDPVVRFKIYLENYWSNPGP